ncbi:hypothetical protein KP509_21G088100 [Ceratopteris richardii]|nr:hypothetical protein KP509_21G088100 [Ceratopteris richardii]
MIETGYNSHLITESVLVDFYSKCGCLQESRRIFDRMGERDVVTWGTMIAAYTQHAEGHSALDLFQKMQAANIKPSMVVMSSILKSCGIIKAIELGKSIHESIRNNGCTLDVVVASALIDMYAKCGCIVEARNVFDGMGYRDIVTWGTMICSYVARDELYHAFSMLDSMQAAALTPNRVILESLLRGCTCTDHIGIGRYIHSFIVVLGLNKDAHIMLTLADMYAKVGCLEEAEKVFLEFPHANVQSWDAFIVRNIERGNDSLAFKFFDKMKEIDVSPNRLTILHLLGACDTTKTGLRNCRLLHDCAIRNALESDLMICSALLDSYSKCGRVESAKRIFSKLSEPDLVTWGAMMQGYVLNGHDHAALELFEKMLTKGLSPSKVILSSISKACSSLVSMEKGRWIHDQVVRKAFEDDVIIGSSLIDMYSKCHHVRDAEAIFLKLSTHDTTAWGAIIAGLAANEDTISVLKYFEDMQKEGFKPDKVVFSCLLKACSCMKDLCQGRIICDQIIRSGVVTDVVLQNSVIHMYAKCGSLDEARKIFEGFQNKDIVSWGAIIAAYVAEGHNVLALELLERMQKEGIQPNKVVFLSCLKACGAAGCLIWTRLLHDKVIRAQLDSDRAIGNSLIDIYGKFGSLDEAQRVLDALQSRDSVSWACMMSGLAYDGKTFLAKEYLKSMESHGLKPGETNFINFLSSCTHTGVLNDAINCLEDLDKEHDASPNVQLFGCIIDLLARTGYQKEAKDLIQTMPIFPDAIAWTPLLTSYKTFGNLNKA